MVHRTLSAGHDSVVVSQLRTAGLLFSKQLAIDSTNTGNQPISGCCANQIVHFSAPALSCVGESSILHKAAWVADIGNVLPGREHVQFMAFPGGLGAGFIQSKPVPFKGLRQIW